MNTHQKAFFVVATTLGCMAMTFASPAPLTSHVLLADLPAVTVVGHRHIEEVAFEKSIVVGHRSDVMLAERSNTASNS